MAATNFLIPWHWGARRLAKRDEQNPFDALQRQINRLFEDVWAGFDLAPFHHAGSVFDTLSPKIDVSESAKKIEISVELPGLDENDIEVTLADDVLTIAGEKKAESEHKDETYFVTERSYGRFRRTIKLPPGINSDKTKAAFDKGVLRITVPKKAAAKEWIKKIAIGKR